MADDFDEDENWDYDEDEYLDLDGRNSPDQDLFRPSLADRQKVGFFSQDRNTQTEESEIIDLKEMTEVLQVLVQDVNAMKRDILFSKHVMQADFEAKLQTKALELYCRVNNKLTEIEKNHEERVDVVRRSFKQQLSDALARMATYYTKDLQRKMNREKTKKEMEAGKVDEKIKELQMTIKRNESVIEMLKMQLEQYQLQALEHQELENEVEVKRTASKKKIPRKISGKKDFDVKSKSPSINEEAERLMEEVEELEEKIKRMEKSLADRDDTAALLNIEIEQLTKELEKERVKIAQMKMEREEILAKQEQNNASSKRMMESQRLAMEKEIEEKLRKAKEEFLKNAQKDVAGLAGEHESRLRSVLEAKRLLEEQLAEERAKNANKVVEETEDKRSHKNDARMRSEVNRLKAEIERIHKMWERKFAILQQSLHALKDESFLRQTLQRQSAQLHTASISYATDAPLAILPTNQKGFPAGNRKTLPDIPKTPKSQGDFISYTVSAPSGRGTGLFSLDENQVMSDGEQDLPDDIKPLPGPPPRGGTDCGENSRPTSKGRVVILPEVTAQ